MEHASWINENMCSFYTLTEKSNIVKCRTFPFLKFNIKKLEGQLAYVTRSTSTNAIISSEER